MKRFLLIISLFFTITLVFAQNIEQIHVETKNNQHENKDKNILLSVYLPTVFNYSNGDSNYFYGFDNNFVTQDFFTFDLETKVLIKKITNLNLNLVSSVMLGGILDLDNKYAIKISTGIGCYYTSSNENYYISGLYIFLYPIYGFPLIPFNEKLVSNWRIALDFGFSLPFHKFNLSYYFRSNFLWLKENFVIKPDFGISFGMYL